MNALVNTIINSIVFLEKAPVGQETDNAAGVLNDILRSFCMAICQKIYPLISYFYQLFIQVSKINLLEDLDVANSIYKRITMLLGIIMLFVSIFYLIRLLLDPDKTNDKEMGVGSLIKRLVVVIILIGFTPTIFGIALDLQHAVIDENIIGKIVIGKQFAGDDPEISSQQALENYGYELETYLFTQIYEENTEVKAGSRQDCVEYEDILSEIENEGTLDLAGVCLNKRGTVDNRVGEVLVYSFKYEHILSVVLGIAMLWFMIVYTLNVGVRTIQFAYLQVIAPIPIISYIVPKKDNMLNRWFKQVVTTYIDLFIRLAIIYFVIYLSGEIKNIDFSDQLLNPSIGKWINIILIFALFLFARRFPQLLQELTGKSSAASMGFGLGGSNAAAGFLLGATSTAAMNFMGSTGAARFTGALRGAVSGGLSGTAQGSFQQNMDRRRQREKQNNQNDEWLKMQGYNGISRLWNRGVVGSGGIPRGLREDYAAQIYGNVKDLIDNEDEMKAINAWEARANSEGYTALVTSLTGTGNLTTNPDGTMTIRDINGRQIYHGESFNDSNQVAIFKEMKQNAGTNIIQHTKNQGIVNGLTRIGYVEGRSRRLPRPINIRSYTYKQLKDRANRHKANRTINPPPHGGPQRPMF